MGFFDFFKSEPKQNQTFSNQSYSMNQQVFRDVTQAVAMRMHEVGITNRPILTYIKNDQGLFETMFQQHITQQSTLALKQKSEDLYIAMLGMHALGMGMYVTLLQIDYKHPVEEFTSSELQNIIYAVQRTDAYELGLNRMGIPINSGNKKVLDHIISTGLMAAKASAGSKICNPENIKAYMQVLYNAGNTVVMRE